MRAALRLCLVFGSGPSLLESVIVRKHAHQQGEYSQVRLRPERRSPCPLEVSGAPFPSHGPALVDNRPPHNHYFRRGTHWRLDVPATEFGGHPQCESGHRALVDRAEAWSPWHTDNRSCGAPGVRPRYYEYWRRHPGPEAELFSRIGLDVFGRRLRPPCSRMQRRVSEGLGGGDAPTRCDNPVLRHGLQRRSASNFFMRRPRQEGRLTLADVSTRYATRTGCL